MVSAQNGYPLMAFVAVAYLAGCAAGGELPPGGEGYSVGNGMSVGPGGEAIFLKGINVREEAKYHSAHLIPLTDREIALLRESGFTTIRLLTFWQAIMPEKEKIDQDYLERLFQEADRLAQAGFFIVFDLHQDLWGVPFGDGAPDWACPEELKAGYQAEEPWWSNYFSPQVKACFDNFWQDVELQELYARALSAAAEKLCVIKNLVGFDLMNEPFPGTAFGQRDFDNSVLLPFYQELCQSLSTVCPQRLCFIEPSRAYDFGLADPLEIAYPLSASAVLAPHFYPAEVHEPGAGYNGDRAALETSLVDLYGDFGTRGIALWFGEFGGLTENPGYGQYLVDLQDIFTRHLWTGALWAYSLGEDGFSFLDAAGKAKAVFSDFLAPPSPVRLPSRPDRMSVSANPPFLEADFSCRRSRRLEILLPGEGRWKAEFGPTGVLTQPQVEGRLLSARCLTDQEATLHLEKIP
jgi:hypothetical protein